MFSWFVFLCLLGGECLPDKMPVNHQAAAEGDVLERQSRGWWSCKTSFCMCWYRICSGTYWCKTWYGISYWSIQYEIGSVMLWCVHGIIWDIMGCTGIRLSVPVCDDPVMQSPTVVTLRSTLYILRHDCPLQWCKFWSYIFTVTHLLFFCFLLCVCVCVCVCVWERERERERERECCVHLSYIHTDLRHGHFETTRERERVCCLSHSVISRYTHLPFEELDSVHCYEQVAYSTVDCFIST